MPSFDQVLFADVCKEGATPLSSHAAKLQNDGLLPPKWRLASAQRTYNPLGSTITFLNKADIKWETLHLARGAAYVAEHQTQMDSERQT